MSEGEESERAETPAEPAEAVPAAETPAATPADASESADASEPACPACARYKHTPRSAELRRDVTCRLNRVIGQLNGVKAMIDDNRYCGDVLTQLAAAQSALSAVSRKLLQNHMETCVVERIQQGDTEVIDELMQLIKKFS